jgi:hypothetical protein
MKVGELMLTESEQTARLIEQTTKIAKDVERSQNLERVEGWKLAFEQWGDAAYLCPSRLYAVSTHGPMFDPVVTDARRTELLEMCPIGQDILRDEERERAVVPAEEEARAKLHDTTGAAAAAAEGLVDAIVTGVAERLQSGGKDMKRDEVRRVFADFKEQNPNLKKDGLVKMVGEAVKLGKSQVYDYLSDKPRTKAAVTVAQGIEARLRGRGRK